MADILMGLQSFKIAFDSLKALSEIRDDNARALAIAEVVGQLSKAQGDLIATQQRELALADEKRALEAEIMRFKDWAAEKERYQLTAHGDNGALAYTLKDPATSSEPAHSLCPTCFLEGKKALLQRERYYDRGEIEMLVCHVCDTRLYTHGEVPKRSEYGRKPR